MAKYEVSEKNVTAADGKKLEVGSTVEVKGKLPGYLVNKVRPLSAAKDGVVQACMVLFRVGSNTLPLVV